MKIIIMYDFSSSNTSRSILDPIRRNAINVSVNLRLSFRTSRIENSSEVRNSDTSSFGSNEQPEKAALRIVSKIIWATCVLPRSRSTKPWMISCTHWIPGNVLSRWVLKPNDPFSGVLDHSRVMYDLFNFWQVYSNIYHIIPGSKYDIAKSFQVATIRSFEMLKINCIYFA